MQAFFDLLASDRDFLETGGSVLMTIVLVTFLMWTLLFERFCFRQGRFLKRRLKHEAQSCLRITKNLGTMGQECDECLGTSPSALPR